MILCLVDKHSDKTDVKPQQQKHTIPTTRSASIVVQSPRSFNGSQQRTLPASPYSPLTNGVGRDKAGWRITIHSKLSYLLPTGLVWPNKQTSWSKAHQHQTIESDGRRTSFTWSKKLHGTHTHRDKQAIPSTNVQASAIICSRSRSNKPRYR